MKGDKNETRVGYRGQRRPRTHPVEPLHEKDAMIVTVLHDRIAVPGGQREPPQRESTLPPHQRPLLAYQHGAAHHIERRRGMNIPPLSLSSSPSFLHLLLDPSPLPRVVPVDGIAHVPREGIPPLLAALLVGAVAPPTEASSSGGGGG